MLGVKYYYIFFLVYKVDGSVMVIFISKENQTSVFIRNELQNK